ncbi:unnamed protein product [Closterium sp. Naga37s-1]|nr:unnamed protein product [Closterium sp. Naga37s-1]
MPRAPRLAASTDHSPSPSASTAAPASGNSSLLLLPASRTLGASPGMVTVPPLPSLAADGRQVRISLRPAFPRARGVGRANVPPHSASCPTVSVGAESVTLPSVYPPAAHAAPGSEVPQAAFLRVSADDQPSAIPHPASLRAAPFAVAALPSWCALDSSSST